MIKSRLGPLDIDHDALIFYIFGNPATNENGYSMKMCPKVNISHFNEILIYMSKNVPKSQGLEGFALKLDLL